MLYEWILIDLTDCGCKQHEQLQNLVSKAVKWVYKGIAHQKKWLYNKSFLYIHALIYILYKMWESRQSKCHFLHNQETVWCIPKIFPSGQKTNSRVKLLCCSGASSGKILAMVRLFRAYSAIESHLLASIMHSSFLVKDNSKVSKPTIVLLYEGWVRVLSWISFTTSPNSGKMVTSKSSRIPYASCFKQMVDCNSRYCCWWKMWTKRAWQSTKKNRRDS